jgi:hypothetical protein
MGKVERGGIIVPSIGIIRGFGEPERALSILKELIKAINRRFRVKILTSDIPIGNYELYGTDMSDYAIRSMNFCDAVIAGDISARSNLINYSMLDIAAALGNDIEFLHVKGMGEHSSVNVNIASYFDGGPECRDSEKTVHGRIETRICSRREIMNFVRFVCGEIEERRRKVVFVRDSENEFYADLFYNNLENYLFPISDFDLMETTAFDITEDVLTLPHDFDTLITSKTTLDLLYGMYKFLLGRDFSAYFRFERKKGLYCIKSVCSCFDFGESVPTLDSYIMAFADMLDFDLLMKKEAFQLRLAISSAHENGFSSENADEYLNEIIKELEKPMTKKFKKADTKRENIR